MTPGKSDGSKMRIAVFGLGEAGSLVSADLAGTGVSTRGYDPADLVTPKGVTRTDSPGEAVVDADVVIALTQGSQAFVAIQQALEEIPSTALYADFSSSSPGTKKRLAEIAAARGLVFADIALLGTVPGNGIRTPALAAGSGADRFVNTFATLGMPVSRVSNQAGDAAMRKLLRSVMMKGLAGCVIEAMRAAEKAGCAQWLWDNLAHEITHADERLLSRLVRGSGTHAIRRLHEMEASLAMLKELGVDHVMTQATVENLRRIPEQGLPDIPVLPD